MGKHKTILSETENWPVKACFFCSLTDDAGSSIWILCILPLGQMSFAQAQSHLSHKYDVVITAAVRLGFSRSRAQPPLPPCKERRRGGATQHRVGAWHGRVFPWMGRRRSPPI